MGETFGFTVRHGSDYSLDGGLTPNGKFEVYLPHSCDQWSITGGYQGSNQDQAIIDLEDFIREAQRALEALRRGEEFGED